MLRDIVLGGSGGSAPLIKMLEDFGGLRSPSIVKLLRIFLKFLYSAGDLQTYFNIC